MRSLSPTPLTARSGATLVAVWGLGWWPLQQLVADNRSHYPWPQVVLGCGLIAIAGAVGYLLTAPRSRDGRTTPVVWLFTLSFFALDLTARALYFALTPGVPDAAQIPNPMVPWFFWRYRSGDNSILTSPSQTLVWLAACLSYVWPTALATGACADRRELRNVLVLAALLVASAAWRLWHWTDLFFTEEPYDLAKALWIAAREVGWLAGLTALGVALGLARRRRLVGAALQ